jgi:hypothetical protein
LGVLPEAVRRLLLTLASKARGKRGGGRHIWSMGALSLACETSSE